MSAEFSVGSIFEVTAKERCRYLQYTHLSEMGVPLLGVLEEEHSTPVGSAREIRRVSYTYFILYAVFEAAKRGLVRFVGALPIPAEYRGFPNLRSPGPPDANGKANFWFIYNVPVTFNYERLKDPSVRYKARELTENQKQLSTTDILSHATLLERLESGWMPKDEI